MVLEWREREHEEVDVAVDIDLWAQMALKICVLYKFWALKGMREHVRFLEMLVDYWDPDSESFNLNGKSLMIEVNDIYFLTRLSRRGEVVNLKFWEVGRSMNIEEYIDSHCVAGTPKVESQLPIRAINNLNLKIIVLVLTRIIGSASLHWASSSLNLYDLYFLIRTVYDWCTSLLANMKSHLTECKQGGKRNFGFASILCSFFFEQVLGLGPIFDIISRGPHDPAMAWWTKLMRR
jgi:hypothetical protein